MAAISDDVRRFLHDNIASVAQLEVLLQLHDDQREWSTGELAAELKSQPEAVEMNVARLASAGLVKARVTEETLCFTYAATGAAATTVERLAALYKSHRVAVVETIFSPPDDPLADFADAFRLGGR